jgi:Pla-1/cef family extracellular lipase
MKKLIVSLAVISALGLSGCDSETVEDAKNDLVENGTPIVATARVVFDPGADTPVLSIPNDLLLSGSQDGTLNLPAENLEDDDGKALPVDYFNPSAAVGALDGWSTINPFVLDIDFPEGTSLSSDSVFSPASVKIFETVMGGDTLCKDVTPVAACGFVAELTFGVDFIAKASGNSVAIIPLKPLKAKTGYVVALTNNLKDNNGKAVAGSTSYETVRQDVSVNPLPEGSLKDLQSIINSYENVIVTAGVDKDSIIYSMSMTTQSIQDVSQVIKSLMLSGIPGTTPVLSEITPTGANAAMLLGLNADDLGAGTQASYASVSKSTLSAPYYLETPYYDPNDLAGSCDLTSTDLTVGCSDLFSRWTAMGDSPATVSGALTSGVLSQQAFAEQAAAQGQDAADLLANPAKLVGLTFTVPVTVGDTVVNVPIDQTRHLTKYNPLPQVKSYKNDADGSAIDVIITTPDVDRINEIAALKKGSALTSDEMMVMPDNGWPVMIYSHGITSYKETVLAISGALSGAGVATISIDHPYHGARSTDFNGDGVYEISATLKEGDPAFAQADPSSYINLQSLLTARDNVRQSEVDILALRGSLNDESLVGVLDASKVSFFGLSWGAITGTSFIALANTGVVNSATGELLAVNPYAVDSASLASAGGGLAGVLLESPRFGPSAMAGLTASDAFKTLLEEETGMSVDSMSEQEYTDAVALYYPAFAQTFNIAAQWVLDSSDPINYAESVQQSQTPIHFLEVIGTGVEVCENVTIPENCSDQVVINSSDNLPLVGSEPLISVLGLSGISDSLGDGTSSVSAVVRFLKGHHSSALNPAAVAGIAEDADANLAVTVEMQTEIVNFAVSGGKYLPVTDNTNVAPVE